MDKVIGHIKMQSGGRLRSLRLKGRKAGAIPVLHFANLAL